MDKFKQMNPDSKLWIYQANRELTPTEIDWIQEQLNAYTEDWAAHGNQLHAAGFVLESHFVALAVDSSQAVASGCSVDNSVRFIKDLGKELNVDFFNRLKMITENQTGEKSYVTYKQLSETPADFVYNPLVNRLGDLDSKFKMQVDSFLNLVS